MDALKQYIDLYKAHRELLERGSCEPMNGRRAEALASLEKHGLPPFGAETFEITDAEALLSPDYGINLGAVPLNVDPMESFRCDIPAVSTTPFFLINDIFAASARSREMLPEGVYVGSIRAAMANEELRKVVGRWYGTIADINNPFVALNTLLARDGVLVYLPPHVRLEKPLQLVNILRHTMPLMAVRRLLIVADEGSYGELLVCDHTQTDAHRFLTLGCVEMIVGPDADFSLYDLEESTSLTARLHTLYLHQEARSSALLDAITLSNGHTRNEFHCDFMAPDASLELLGMGIEDGDSRLDTYTRIAHNVEGCRSNELFKYVADGASRCAFTGRIYVAEGARRTDSYQANRNILGSDEARIYSRPQLEIYNDDVKCSHGSAIGQLDTRQLFYMQTRGISLSQAKLLLKQAFMTDVIDGVRLETLRARLRHLVECRFAGKDASCAACHVSADSDKS